MSADMSHLHRNIISHPLPEVVGKVNLRPREYFVYDCLWDPALQTTETKKENVGFGNMMLFLCVFFLLLVLEYISVQIHVVTVEKKISHTFRSIFSNQMNLVLFGSSAQGFMTIQVGPFSALKHAMYQFKWNPHTSISH